jgi:hypothetical protein
MPKRAPSGGGAAEEAPIPTKLYTLVDGELWPRTPRGNRMDIEIVGGTGEYKSGKTLFGFSIAPGEFTSGPFAGKPRTKVYDLEKSSSTYSGARVDRTDVYDLVTSKFRGADGKVKNFSIIDVFNILLGDIETIKQSQFDVIMIDPISDIEDGIVNMVKDKPDQFGLTSEQVKKGGGLLWGAVKNFYKSTLLRALAGRCKTFYYTVHLRDEFKGGAPTGRREPKGKDTLMELAGLYLWFEREPIRGGTQDGAIPDLPSANVVKHRVSDTYIGDDGDLHVEQLLPPRLPVATVMAIRNYIATGVNLKKLKPDERAIEKTISEEEMLRLKTAAAEKEIEANQSAIDRLDRQAKLRAMAAATANPPTAEAQLQTAQQEKRVANAAASTAEAARETDKPKVEVKTETKPADTSLRETLRKGEELAKQSPDNANVRQSCTKEQMVEMQGLCKDLGIVGDKLKELIGKVGKSQPKDLDFKEAAQLIAYLKKQKEKN